VSRFILYDNFSKDSPEAQLRPDIDAGVVSIVRWEQPLAAGGQTSAYTNCLERLADWLAGSPLDVDEFLFSPEGAPLPQVLSRFEAYPGVVAHGRSTVRRITKSPMPTVW
jgi:hypothetical protein